MGLGQLLKSIADLAGARFGFGGFAAAAVLLVAGYLVDTLWVRRKRIHWRIQYNSKLGLIPNHITDPHQSSPEANPQIEHLAKALDRMSIVVIRFRNASGFDIDADHFEQQPYVHFGRRVVWDARVSDPTDEPLRDLISGNLSFSRDESAAEPAANGAVQLNGVRARLPRVLARLLGQEPPVADEPEWHAVHLTKLSLKRKEKFKLLVVLGEPEDNTSGEISKDDIKVSGRIKNGKFSDERRIPRFSWPKASLLAGVLAAGAAATALVLSMVVAPAAPADAALECGSGALRIVGSSAFMPIMDQVRAGYTSRCRDATISTEAMGSIDGVRELNKPGLRGDSLAALSDGQPTSEPTAGLVPQPVAVVVYGVIVNNSAGVDRLTLRQLQDIYAGRYRDWNELRPGPSVPIDIVGRGQESGSRQIFESQVLHGSEGELSSNSCARQDRPVQAATTRCERGSTADVIQLVASTPGAIGYADVPAVGEATASGQPLTTVKLDESYPDVSYIPRGYPFWTVEYLYTKGTPEPGSLLRKFLGYLRNDSARATLQDAGYTPCIGKDGLVSPLCTKR
ncbi:phosphate-binding protein [Amycolatopsis sp. K13G38]|uniref:Phosphate-binding protein n=1 Tax=Amycolatopsis acididurans TaxID=2724524 RepID=A0ABX1JA19_9PSEU|nr:substrate-binding domain-containing protein [Amycolatopsis acididurans]NKQ56608.1 phosphate-binding protein [Amycolatopsis acididurans]